jgi:TAP C-terminal domain
VKYAEFDDAPPDDIEIQVGASEYATKCLENTNYNYDAAKEMFMKSSWHPCLGHFNDTWDDYLISKRIESEGKYYLKELK